MANLMTLAKGQEFDIGRMVKQRVGFKRSYDMVIKELTHISLSYGEGNYMGRGEGCCASCDCAADIREYLYNQMYDDRFIDNVRTSYLIRKSSNTYYDFGKKWAKSKGIKWCQRWHLKLSGNAQSYIPEELLDEMKYYESLALDIWYYVKEHDTDTLDMMDLFYPEYSGMEEDELLDAISFCKDGMDPILQCAFGFA